jgi:signal transduction histidine kinase
MGLGLAIVRNAVAVHGGTVTARNVSPHGLEVELRIPVAGSELPPRNSAAQLVAPLQGRR